MTRRDTLKILFGAALAVAAPMPSFASYRVEDVANSETEYIFDQVMKEIRDKKWNALPIGLLMANIGKLFIGTPYKGGTLESPETERCMLNLTGLDCVTLYENVLCMARIAKKEQFGLPEMFKELQFVRYQNGHMTDYASRLHYTTEWIADNRKKGTIRDLTAELNAVEKFFDLRFMSQHPQYYAALKANPALVDKIASNEEVARRQPMSIVQGEKAVKNAQKSLADGDIIAIISSVEGLDYAHTGLIAKEKGKVRFLHASSKSGKVILDKDVLSYLRAQKNSKAFTAVRPLEPNT